ncbi:MAG: Hsp20/alpha crystallin family protein [Pseudomonadota bacterium]
MAAPEDRSLPVFAEFDEIVERIRQRAFELFSSRGYQAGQKLDDWLTAEREICWPAAELKEGKKTYKVKVALAGFDGDDITVTAGPSELIVKASQESSTEDERESGDENVQWSEFHSKEVFRRIDMPGEIDLSSVTADFKHGMLKITARKAIASEQDQPQKVSVKSAA